MILQMQEADQLDGDDVGHHHEGLQKGLSSAHSPPDGATPQDPSSCEFGGPQWSLAGETSSFGCRSFRQTMMAQR